MTEPLPKPTSTRELIPVWGLLIGTAIGLLAGILTDRNLGIMLIAGASFGLIIGGAAFALKKRR